MSKRRRGKPTADPLDRRLANVQTRLRHRYQELLTAVTEHLVIGANIRLDLLHRGLKHLVAYEMAVGVIDDLEVVQVHNSNKALLNMPFNHLKHLAQIREHINAALGTGECVAPEERIFNFSLQRIQLQAQAID